MAILVKVSPQKPMCLLHVLSAMLLVTRFYKGQDLTANVGAEGDEAGGRGGRGGGRGRG